MNCGLKSKLVVSLDYCVSVCVCVCVCVCAQLVSEEHEESTAATSHIDSLPGVTGLQLMKQAELVEKKDITIWIDPLDATQEYTGMTFFSLKSYSLENVLEINFRIS